METWEFVRHTDKFSGNLVVIKYITQLVPIILTSHFPELHFFDTFGQQLKNMSIYIFLQNHPPLYNHFPLTYSAL